MTTPLFPRALLREKSHSWNLIAAVKTPGQTSDYAAVVQTDGGGFWSCAMQDVSLSGRKGSDLQGRERQKISTLLWRAVRQICAGGINSIIVPRNDALFRPYPKGERDVGPVPHSDGMLFSDGAGYHQRVLDVVTYGAAPRRAVSIGLQLNHCGPLQGGEAFSIEHPTAGWRMYEISTIDQIDDTHAVVTFLPPLREAVPEKAYVEMDRPCCTMRLASSSAMDLTVQPWTFNNASVNFIEAPTT